MIKFADVAKGDELPAQTFPVRRLDLVKYAGASGDFNPIHWNERFAQSVGLPDVIAHGMFTMAEAVRVVTDWCGDPGLVVEYSVRFTKPVVVPDGVDEESGARLTVTGKVGAVNEDGTVRVDLTAVSADEKVLGMARALVRLP
ncbi:MaoC family dehydratase [Catenulispora subtropica]|uniref:MaoC family dehydratase n=1 Tax=Catenulispora subtropica TaxID=450798 RepID=A0ABN2R3K0_9ACTN